MVNAMFVLLLILRGMAGICQDSKSVLTNVQKNFGLRLKRGSGVMVEMWRKRFRWSCPPVKIKLGNLNFVDRCTPLTISCLNIVNRLIVHKLLVAAGNRVA